MSGLKVTQSYGTLTRSVPKVNQVYEEFKKEGAVFSQAGPFPIELPLEFDGRVVWKNYLSPIREQGKCGNCFAISTVDCLGDRYSLFTFGQIKPPLAACSLTICEYDDLKDVKAYQEAFQSLQEAASHSQVALANAACFGNTLYNAAKFCYYQGIPYSSCCGPESTTALEDPLEKILQNFTDPKQIPLCEKLQGLHHLHCSDQTTAAHIFRTRTFGSIAADNGNEDLLKFIIYKFGPVAGGFDVFPDFLHDYDGKGIYVHQDRPGELSSGGHAVRIVGWGGGPGTSEPIPYWIIANSWGTQWGDAGYFKMKRGMESIGLEKNLVATLPMLNGFEVNPPVAKVLLSPAEQAIHDSVKIDPVTKYNAEALPLIQAGKLVGDLHPIINYDFVLENVKNPVDGTWYAGRDVPEIPPHVPVLPAVPVEVLMRANGVVAAAGAGWWWVAALAVLIVFIVFLFWRKSWRSRRHS